MSRRGSGPQRKRRQREFDPLKRTGIYQPPQKHSLSYRILHSKWTVFGFMGTIALGMVVGTVCGAYASNNNASTVRDQRVFETATPEGAATGTPDPNRTVTATPTAAPTPVRRYAAPPEMAIDPQKQYFATIRTEKGDVRLELYPKEAPLAVNNFVFLARNDFYDGLTFHRVVRGFVAQAGDPTNTGAGTGGPGYDLPAERNALKHETGSIAMAKAGSITSGSQFYITYGPQPNLDQQGFTVFGKVVSGMDVLQSLSELDAQRNPRAAFGDRIQDIIIEER